MRLLVTGGAGFIGSAVVRRLISETRHTVITVDKLTYAGNLESLAGALAHPRHFFEQVDVCDARELARIFAQYDPDAVLHLAAESHVDRSIDGPADFIRTNLVGTFTLLDAALVHWRRLNGARRNHFRFIAVSTDEVFGALGPEGHFDEHAPYRPSSPYSASKAGADHLARAWRHTYALPVIVTNSSNNYGPYQFPEKLIPLMILNAMEGRSLPVYGRGHHVRDWLHVEDHVDALLAVLDHGVPGETYLVGGHGERRSLEVVRAICALLDELAPMAAIGPRERLIRFVEDRPGHDYRYAINPAKIERELGWQPRHTFESGLRETVQWYLANRDWCERVQAGEYQRERLGLGMPPATGARLSSQ